MNSLALINEFLGQPPNASEHGYQIDHIIEFSHWFMGALLLAGTGITVALSYVDFGTRKANVGVAMLVATLKAGLVAAIFMHLAAEKRLIYRVLIFTGFFVLALFGLIFLAWYNPIVR